MASQAEAGTQPAEQPADFIAVYPNALDPAVCRHLIDKFQRTGAARPGRVGGGVFPALKRSLDLTISGQTEWHQEQRLLEQALLPCLAAYVRRYPHALIAPFLLQTAQAEGSAPRRVNASDIRDMSEQALNRLLVSCFRPGAVNLQHYLADQGGYPYWHCELFPSAGSPDALHRHLLWSVYLNEEFEGGETEFLHQARSIEPRTGALLIAPTAFTHTHRGNTPRGGDKYIATSWVLFHRSEGVQARAHERPSGG